MPDALSQGEPEALVDLRCSTQARDGGADPAGTAAAADAFLLVEMPLPWPADIADHPCLDGVAEVARRLGARIQGIVPAEESMATGTYRVVLYRRPPGPFVAYERREVVASLGEIADACRSVADAPVDTSTRTDVLVCTHGTRDRCCGALGTSLFLTAAAALRGPSVRVQRTSHTGGHRFAPTALVLPHGTAWAWLDQARLAQVVRRGGDVGDVLPHYRGSTAMASPALQVAERAVFAAVGWPWLDTPRSGDVVDRDEGRTVVRIASSAGSWRAVVARVRTRPQPRCGVAPGSEQKADDELEIVELTHER